MNHVELKEALVEVRDMLEEASCSLEMLWYRSHHADLDTAIGLLNELISEEITDGGDQ